MVDFAAKDLGKMLGKMSQEQARIQENIYPDDPDAQLLLQIPETITLTESATLTRKDYPTNSFIVDHPVYGNVDSSTLLIDGGYAWENYDITRVAHYSFENNVTDSEGNYNGTATSLTYTSSGISGSAGDFNGTTSRVDLTASNTLLGTGVWSISAWAKADTISAASVDDRVFTSMRDAGSLTHVGVGFGGSTKIQMQYRTSGGTTVDRDIITTAVTGTWYHIALSYNGSTIACYINGSNVLNESVTLIAPSTGTATIGSRGANNYFDGLIDEVTVWRRELAAGEALNLYNSGSGRAFPQNNLISSTLQVIP